MRYRDLVQYDPIESVIQLRSANVKDAAARLVETYVISERMAEQLVHVVIPQLSLSGAIDHKGVLVVGNYGTGKSHFMSVLSALAEHSDLVPMVRNAKVRAAAGQIAGRFMVVRGEIGGVTQPLRDIVLGELERCFARAGTPYTFPPASAVPNNKDPLIQAMEGFSARHPDMGVLFVLDELLDFLRTREERELILDLGFLRELGEVAAATPFRFLSGVQETLFDNPRFTFVADQLRRVKDRFEQVRIAREDVAFVVAERLLRKTAEQRARITNHLLRFNALYPQMAHHLAEYVRLFPIHPAYIEVFERVYIAEKREVLRTFSDAIRHVLDHDVPEDQPGLISYDQYWDILRGNLALRTLPGVLDVVQKSDVLLDRVAHSYTRGPLQPMALRIIHGLSVQRLTSELDTPLGVTAEELRDQLCLWVQMPEQAADFLADQVRVALREILRTVNGQYITCNQENGQYYLDLKKDIDFDAQIEERGNLIEERDLNGYFYLALAGLLNLPQTTYVTNSRVWLYELPWQAHNVTRPGYLFLGSPRERSTAQPPRDFYLYFLPPFDAPNGRLENNADEVAFALSGIGPEFTELVRRFAGAQARANEASNHRQVYTDKADQHRRALVTWVREHLIAHLRIIHRGSTRTVAEVLAQTRSSASADPEELLRLIADHLLAPHFQETYPNYPAFKHLAQPITEKSRETAARDAINFLARSARTNLAIGVLAGLGLLDANERVRPIDSPYARSFLEQLEAKPVAQVVNRGEVLTQVASAPAPVFKDVHFKLEPEWVAVVLLALVYDGAITLNLGNETLDASNIARAAGQSFEALVDFRFYRRPQELPLSLWRQIFEALDLPPGLVADESTREDAVRRLQERVTAEVSPAAELLAKVRQGVTVCGTPLFTDTLSYIAPGGIVTPLEHHEVTLLSTEVRPQVQRAKELLDTLGTYNTPGKLRNLALTSDELRRALTARATAKRVAETFKTLGGLQPLTEYLAQALVLLPTNDAWIGQARTARDELVTAARRAMKGEGHLDPAAWRSRLEELRRIYVDTYVALHNHHRLSAEGDDRKGRLPRDSRFVRLRALSQVDLLPTEDLTRWHEALLNLPACREFHPQLLEAAPECPRCHFHPTEVTSGVSAASRLNQLDEQLGLMVKQWDAALRANLESDAAKASRQHMTVAERRTIEAYLTSTAPDVEVPLPANLIEAANQALHGLHLVSFDAHQLLAALANGGFPCSEAELRKRFDDYLHTRLQGTDSRNTRLTIAQGNGGASAVHAGGTVMPTPSLTDVTERAVQREH